jgi:hypothetical protein
VRGLAFQWVVALTALGAIVCVGAAVITGAVYGIGYMAGWTVAGMTL